MFRSSGRCPPPPSHSRPWLGSSDPSADLLAPPPGQPAHGVHTSRLRGASHPCPRFRQLSPDLHNRPRGGLSSAIVVVIVIFAAESMPPSLLGSLPDSAWLRVKSQCACIPEATCPLSPSDSAIAQSGPLPFRSACPTHQAPPRMLLPQIARPAPSARPFPLRMETQTPTFNIKVWLTFPLSGTLSVSFSP